MNIENLEQLAEENPIEYVRQAFEDKGDWYSGVFLVSGKVQAALQNYLLNFEINKTPLIQIMHAIGEVKSPDLPPSEWVQNMADNFEQTQLWSLFTEAFDRWAHISESQYYYALIGAKVENFFDYLGNCLYKEYKDPTMTLVDKEPHQWHKSIDAKAHTELLIRFLNTRLEKEEEFKCWSKRLPLLFRSQYAGINQINKTGLYFLFLHQMFTLDKPPFVFTQLSRRTKALLTLCFYQCEWDYQLSRYILESEHFHEYDMFIRVTDMILKEKMYLPEELDPDLTRMQSDVKGFTFWERMRYGSENSSFVKAITNTRNKNEEYLEQLILDYIHLRRPSELMQYVDGDSPLYTRSLLNVLKIFLSTSRYGSENELIQSSVAKMLLEHSSKSYYFQQIDSDKWSIVYELAQEIVSN